jgi:hypothetical protein
MFYSILADIVVVIHLAFILFVALGGLLALRLRPIIWLHVPALIWAMLLEFRGWICPLTPLENWLRFQAGEAGYHGGFIEHYLIPLMYPAGLTRDAQMLIGALAFILNICIYGYVWFCRRAKT